MVRGFSLIEVMLVLAIIAAILVLALRHYQRLQYGKDLKAIQHSVIYLQQAANLYYLQHCNDINFDNNSDLYSQVLAELPTHLQGFIQNTWNNNLQKPYSIYIRKPDNNPNIYQIIVTTTINRVENHVPSAKALATIASELNGENQGNQIIWTTLPSQKARLIQSSSWIMNGGLQDFAYAMKKDNKDLDKTGLLEVCPQ